MTTVYLLNGETSKTTNDFEGYWDTQKHKYQKDKYEKSKLIAWKAWLASREAIEIKLDDKVMVEDEFDKGHNCAIDYCADAIRSAGLKVKE